MKLSKLHFFLVLIFSAFLFASCGGDERVIPAEESLAQEWTFDIDDKAAMEDAHLNLNSQVVRSVSVDSKPYLSVENQSLQTFELVYNDALNITGHWEIDSNLLHLYAYPKPVSYEVDSIRLSEMDGRMRVAYYHNGDMVGAYDHDVWRSSNHLMTFAYQMPESNQLILDGEGYHLKLNRELEVINSSISFTSIYRGLIGLVVLILIAWLFSSNRKAVNWKVVGIGLTVQLLIALGILKVEFIAAGFEAVSKFFVLILDFTGKGSEFLLGGLLDTTTYGYIFMFQVLPTIIFFSALTSVLFYLGIIQKVVYALAWVMTKFMKLSGAESLSVAGNIFLGQTESPLMIKAYLPKMNNSEILLVMIGGMATIAGGVLAAYVSFLGGDDPVARLMFAKHLLSASIMAAPGAVVISKILVPPTEKVDQNIEITQDSIGSNILDAMANGTTEGLKLAANVGAMLLVFVAFIAMINYVLNDWLGSVTGLNAYIFGLTDGQYDGFSLQFILGYLFAPLMWLIGVNSQDIALVGQLLGEKIIMSEFIAYISLADIKASGAFVSDKSLIMSTYMLCGFANFASIGIQIGGIGVLAPSKRKVLSKFGMKALLGGTLASLLSATMVGMIMG
jgi:CNT family concentrative nucleoside transporter